MGEVWSTAHVTGLWLTASLGPRNGDEHHPTDTELWGTAVDYKVFAFTYYIAVLDSNEVVLLRYCT